MGSVHNLCHVHVSDVDRSRGGRPRKLNRTQEQRCVRNDEGKMCICIDVARSAQ